MTGFDTWGLITSNERLPPILATLSTEIPPPSAEDESSLWTLDTLFILPRTRLKYYKKLYARLLKSTQPGRSDHKLLSNAVEKLEGLITILSQRENMVVGLPVEDQTEVQPQVQTPTAPPSLEAESHPALPEQEKSGRILSNVTGSETTDEQLRGSVGSVPASSTSSGYVSILLFFSLSLIFFSAHENLVTPILVLALHPVPQCQCLYPT